jgi:aminoglycoside N3'-acetyltransferase
VREAMSIAFIRATKQYCKARLKQARRLYIDSFHAFSPADLAKGLRSIGVSSGDTVLVHSSYDSFEGFTGKPSDVISVLKSAVGHEGTLMMPTLPFIGTAVEYARGRPVFDVRRTPSRTGLLTELFRRSPDVLRSVHPTHPVAVWGRGAAEIVEGHHRALTPCGQGSPFERLLKRQGKILLIGTDISVLTFYHTLEELLEEQLPMSPFTAEIFELQSRDPLGIILTTRTRLFEPAMSRRRNLHKLVPELQKHGAWHEQCVARLTITSFKAADVLMAVSAMSQKGAYCYD